MSSKNNKVQKQAGQVPNQFDERAEQKRLLIVESELNARYWKAQYDIMYYTIEGEKLTDEYDKVKEIQKKRDEEAQAKLQASLDEATVNLKAEYEKLPETPSASEGAEMYSGEDLGNEVEGQQPSELSELENQLEQRNPV